MRTVSPPQEHTPRASWCLSVIRDSAPGLRRSSAKGRPPLRRAPFIEHYCRQTIHDRMNPESLRELAESTSARVTAVLVRVVQDLTKSRRRAPVRRCLAGLHEVPVIIKQVPDNTALAMALIENIQREDLNPLEEAQGVQRLIGEFQFTHEQAAQAIGRSRSATSNLLRLTNLVAPVQQMVLDGRLDMGHARALLALSAAQQIHSVPHRIEQLRCALPRRCGARRRGESAQDI